MVQMHSDPLVKQFPFHQRPTLLVDHDLPANPVLLLAEDDDDLRSVMEVTLNAMGFVVLAHPNAELASKAFRSNGRIDVLLTDFQMPGRSGMELARELTSVSPSLPVVINTGSILSDETMSEIAQRNWVHLSKPCNLAVLQSTLYRVLNRQERPPSPSS